MNSFSWFRVHGGRLFIGDLQNYNFKSTQENRSYRVLALYKAEDPHLDGQEYIFNLNCNTHNVRIRSEGQDCRLLLVWF